MSFADQGVAVAVAHALTVPPPVPAKHFGSGWTSITGQLGGGGHQHVSVYFLTGFLLVYSRGGQTIFLTGQISLKYCFAGRKHFWACFLYLFLKFFHIIDVNLGYFPYINVS